jgi:hypothetical protein
VQAVEQKLMLSCSFGCDQINTHCHKWDYTLLCNLSLLHNFLKKVKIYTQITYELILTSKGLFKHMSDFALSLQVYKTNSLFLFSKMNQLIAKSCSVIRHVNKPELPSPTIFVNFLFSPSFTI